MQHQIQDGRPFAAHLALRHARIDATHEIDNRPPIVDNQKDNGQYINHRQPYGQLDVVGGRLGEIEDIRGERECAEDERDDVQNVVISGASGGCPAYVHTMGSVCARSGV